VRKTDCIRDVKWQLTRMTWAHVDTWLKQLRDLMLVVLVVLVLESFQILCSSFLSLSCLFVHVFSFEELVNGTEQLKDEELVQSLDGKCLHMAPWQNG